MEFDKNNFVDDSIDISSIKLSKVLVYLIKDYNQAIKKKNEIKCEELQRSLETTLKNCFSNGEFTYKDWKTLEAKFRIW